MPMRLAAVQMVSGTELETNLRVAERLIGEAVREGAELVVLPENFALFGLRDLRPFGEAEATAAGPIRQFLREQARRHGIWLVGGTLPTAEANPESDLALEPGRVYAACFVVDSRGEEVGRYDKIHLFDVDVGDRQGRYRESDSFQHGSRPSVVDTPWCRLGLAVCYDIRFPEYFRLLMDRGATLVVIPSAFTYVTGRVHWDVLLRARAIENLCYVVGACQGGQHDAKRQTWGHSAIVGPWGKELAQRDQGEGVVVADIDCAEVERVRGQMPVYSHRRFYVDDE